LKKESKPVKKRKRPSAPKKQPRGKTARRRSRK